MQASGREIPAGAQTIVRFAPLVGAPIAFILLALLSAFIMWVVVMVSAEKVRYRGLLSVAVFAEVIAVLTILLQNVVYRIRGSPVEAIQTVADAQVSFGADLLLSADATVPAFVRALLMGIGPLQLWALVIAAIGVSTLEKQSKATGWTAALASYLVGLAVAASLAGLRGG